MESSNIRYRSMTFMKFTKKAFLILFVITLIGRSDYVKMNKVKISNSLIKI